MTKVIRIDVLGSERIREVLAKVDFWDTYATTNQLDDLEEVTLKIFGKTPFWVKWLMVLRNAIVRIFGVRSEKGDIEDIKFEVGGSIGFFEIMELTENEVILGADDKHLNFRVSVLKEQKGQDYNVLVTTVVEYVNTFGKVYMNLINPFHKLIVKRMVKQAFLAKV